METAAALATNIRTIRRDIAYLQAIGMLRREGSSKSGYWIVENK